MQDAGTYLRGDQNNVRTTEQLQKDYIGTLLNDDYLSKQQSRLQLLREADFNPHAL